ncbi:MAG: hypothetical protein FD123_2316 [Bacteroidetes bacterium]|nr:MAG: hypothetical protein FD123_2316 [Bacteroidota bacterium]
MNRFLFFASCVLFTVAPLKSQQQQNPAPLSAGWCTYAGGGDSDDLLGIERFANGDYLVTGYSASLNFPVGTGTVQTNNAGSYDAVIMRIDSTGNRVWATYFGGTGFDAAYHAVIVGNAVYVAGSTNSNDLPVDTNAYQPLYAGGYEAWLLKLDTNGQKIWSTYFGGSGSDAAYDIDADAAGNIYLGGSTTSSNLPLAATTGFQPNWAGALDAWIAKFDSSGQAHWSTYYGGSGSEDAHSITVDAGANIILCGGTFSLNFPTSPGAFQSLSGGMQDVYLLKLDSSGNRIFASMYGGTAGEDAFGLHHDAAGNIYIAGFTQSIDFPLLGTTYQNMNAGMNDAYLMKLNTSGIPLWSTYYGGPQDENAYGLFVHDEYVYFTGNTQSATFPVTVNALQDSLAGLTDAYVVKFDTAGTLVWASFFGGTGADVGNAIVIDPQSAAGIVGNTYSTDLPVQSGVMQTTNMFQGDGFIAAIDASALPIGSALAEKPLAGNDFMLQPTLFENELHWNESLASWMIYDLTGKLVLSGTQETRAETAKLKSGLYVFTGNTRDGKPVTRKIIRK